jgi:hypothetical protein
MMTEHAGEKRGRIVKADYQGSVIGSGDTDSVGIIGNAQPVIPRAFDYVKEGRIGCFSPVSYLSRKDLTLIRPLVLAPEKAVISCCGRNGFDSVIVKSKCPVDKATYRQEMKEFLQQKEREDRGFKLRILTALRKSGVDGWGLTVDS